MLSKIMVGGLAAAVVALGIVFLMLLDAREANGALVSDISRVEAANKRQVVAMRFLKLQTDKLLDQVEKERNSVYTANAALLASELNLEQAETYFQGRLQAAREELSDEERVCAGELVPAVLLDSLYSD